MATFLIVGFVAIVVFIRKLANVYLSDNLISIRQKFCCLFINDYICMTINGIAYEIDKRNLTIA